MRPQAILFDLDITLIDRMQSIQRYAARLQRDDAANLAAVTVADIAAAIVAADEGGYRPREALFAELIQCLPWQTPPAITRLQSHWETWFPASSVARERLVETLRALLNTLRKQALQISRMRTLERRCKKPNGR